MVDKRAAGQPRTLSRHASRDLADLIQRSRGGRAEPYSNNSALRIHFNNIWGQYQVVRNGVAWVQLADGEFLAELVVARELTILTGTGVHEDDSHPVPVCFTHQALPVRPSLGAVEAVGRKHE